MSLTVIDLARDNIEYVRSLEQQRDDLLRVAKEAVVVWKRIDYEMCESIGEDPTPAWQAVIDRAEGRA